MKAIDRMLLGIGALWLFYALTMDTSIAVPGGYGWPNRVQNLELIEARRTPVMLSVGALIIGTILVGFGSLRGPDGHEDDYRSCPFCAEPVRVEAVICRHCRKELPALPSTDVSYIEPSVEMDAVEDPEEGGVAYSYRALRDAAEAAEHDL